MHSMSLWAFSVLAWLIVDTTVATAQQGRGGPQPRLACNSHDKLVEMLGSTYTEAPNAFGLQANGHLLEVFVSRKSGSWTMVSTRPDGVSCIVAAGQHWQDLRYPTVEPAV
jgi:hypothetical protein